MWPSESPRQITSDYENRDPFEFWHFVHWIQTLFSFGTAQRGWLISAVHAVHRLTKSGVTRGKYGKIIMALSARWLSFNSKYSNSKLNKSLSNLGSTFQECFDSVLLPQTPGMLQLYQTLPCCDGQLWLISGHVAALAINEEIFNDCVDSYSHVS